MPSQNKQENRPKPEDYFRAYPQRVAWKAYCFSRGSGGVGKTYAMLEAAHDRLQEGIDIVIGWVETHRTTGNGKVSRQD